jgi:hypothetical protein
LLSTVTAANERLAAQERETALLAIDQKLQEVETSLNHIQADDHLRNKALYPLQQRRISLASLSNIPKIRYQLQQADNELDSAMDIIAAAQKPQSPAIKESGSINNTTSTYSAPAIPIQKPIKVIRAQTFSTKSYLETEAEVDAYLAKLRQVLVATLNEGKKARIE